MENSKPLSKSLFKSRRRFRRVKRNRFASVDQKTSKTYQAGIFLKKNFCEIQDKAYEKNSIIEFVEKVVIPVPSLNSENNEKSQTDSISDVHDIETKPFVNSMDPSEHAGIFKFEAEIHEKTISKSLESLNQIVTSVYAPSYHKTSFSCICQFKPQPFYRPELDVLQKIYKILSQKSYTIQKPWQKSYLEIKKFVVPKIITRPEIKTLIVESKHFFIIKPVSLKEHPINITVFKPITNFGPTCRLNYEKNPLILTKISVNKISKPVTSLQLCQYKPCLKPVLALFEYSQQVPQESILSSDFRFLENNKVDITENSLEANTNVPIEESIFELNLSSSELLDNIQKNTFLGTCIKETQINTFEQNILGNSNALDENEFCLLSSEMCSESYLDREKKGVYFKHLDEIDSESDDEYQII
ncbi:hypothetical protein SteCoe_22424 [Stentor coeruleus]|uniref:Uncharacterized protein n=1 Tax=Stentor coeruleus TaxID=5963 RepID=A0A1R2BMA1_9CILI|nr:hypothetical protein SteCoe_22424 [Stentor coeruleus]